MKSAQWASVPHSDDNDQKRFDLLRLYRRSIAETTSDLQTLSYPSYPTTRNVKFDSEVSQNTPQLRSVLMSGQRSDGCCWLIYYSPQLGPEQHATLQTID